MVKDPDPREARSAGFVAFLTFSLAVGAVLVLCFFCGAVANAWVL